MTTATPIAVALHERITAAYERTFRRSIRQDTLSALELIVRWLATRGDGADRTVITTWAEAAKEIGWPGGANCARTRERHRPSLLRRLNMLVEMGWVEEWRPLYDARGSGEGILIRLGRDSSVGRAHD